MCSSTWYLSKKPFQRIYYSTNTQQLFKIMPAGEGFTEDPWNSILQVFKSPSKYYSSPFQMIMFTCCIIVVVCIVYNVLKLDLGHKYLQIYETDKTLHLYRVNKCNDSIMKSIVIKYCRSIIFNVITYLGVWPLKKKKLAGLHFSTTSSALESP